MNGPHRNRKRARSLQPLDQRDVGTAIRRERGDIVLEHRTDPDPEVKAPVRGGRVRDGLQIMLAHKHISIAQFNAGDRFRNDLDLADGVSLDRAETLGIRVQQTGNNWPGDIQIDAMARVRAARKLLGDAKVLPLAQFFLQQGGTAGEYARDQHVRRETVSKQLQVALNVLVDYYQNVKL